MGVVYSISRDLETQSVGQEVEGPELLPQKVLCREPDDLAEDRAEPELPRGERVAAHVITRVRKTTLISVGVKLRHVDSVYDRFTRVKAWQSGPLRDRNLERGPLIAGEEVPVLEGGRTVRREGVEPPKPKPLGYSQLVSPMTECLRRPGTTTRPEERP